MVRGLSGRVGGSGWDARLLVGAIIVVVRREPRPLPARGVYVMCRLLVATEEVAADDQQDVAGGTRNVYSPTHEERPCRRGTCRVLLWYGFARGAGHAPAMRVDKGCQPDEAVVEAEEVRHIRV